MRGTRHAWMTTVAVAALVGLSCPAAAASTPREQELEARLAELEKAVAELRSELGSARAEQQTMSARIEKAQVDAGKADTRIAAVEARPTPPKDGFNVGGTTIKLNGYIKAVASLSRYDDGAVATGSLGKDFYLPQTIPVGGARSSHDFTAQAKQTRLWLTTATPVGNHMLKGHIEFDFQTSPGTQGSQRTTNGYNLALRRGFLTYDRWVIGQEWSNFQYVSALPETTDFVGTTEGTIFERQMQVRYTVPLTPKLALSLSAENAETASVNSTTATIVENDHDRAPDLTARLTLSLPAGELSLAGIARELSADDGSVDDQALGWGVSAAGKIAFGADHRHDIRFMATYGHGVGRYLGLNFAPDAIFNPAGDGQIHIVRNFAAFAATRLAWTGSVRSTFMASYQSADYPGGILVPGAINKHAWSVAGNLFWSPVKGFDVGAEYRHGERKLVSGVSGQLDRLEFAAKYSF